MAASNKKRKKVVIAALAVAAAILLCVFLTSRKAEEGDSYSRSMEEFYESSYLDYLEDRDFEGVMSQSKAVVDISSFTVDDGMEAVWDGDGVATSERGSITWKFDVEESGFYNLHVTY